jgi:ketosteroid isomerase-like protein
MRLRLRSAMVGTSAAGVITLSTLIGGMSAQPGTGMRAGIGAALDRSAAGWNAGNLDQFMAVYLDSPRTTYATHTKFLHGLAAIRAVYVDRFAKGAARDSLRLVDESVDSLTPTLASVMALYELRHGDSTTARGPTSLLMQRVAGTWYIVHDHSG